MTAVTSSLIAELEAAVTRGSPQQRVQMLRQVTDLFLTEANRLNDAQINVFDEVLVGLIAHIETKALRQLSVTMSDADYGPIGVIRQLAWHEDGSVAAPILSKSSQLTETDLIDIAQTRGQEHLLAISGRKMLNPAVTDVLLERGNSDVAHALAGNDGARFSEFGYATLVETAAQDEDLAAKVGLRPDLPAKVLQDLLSRAADAVVSRLLKLAGPEMRERIRVATQHITDEIRARVPAKVDYTEAENAVSSLLQAGALDPAIISRFALERRYTFIIAALSLLSSVSSDSIEPLVYSLTPNGLTVACRAAGLDWPTTVAIIRNRPNCPPVSKQEMDQCKEAFDVLSLPAAKRTIRFWSARNTAVRTDAPDTPIAVAV